jgi:hypothetical protein
MTQGESEHPRGAAVASSGRMLFAILGGPLAWVVHFLGSYALIAIGCVAGWSAIRESVAVATAALAAVAAWATVTAWREWRGVSGAQPFDAALGEPRGWFAFLMLTGAMLGGVSAFGIVLEGLGSVVLPVCGWDAR